MDIRVECNPDIVADIKEVEFPDGEFEEILMFDVIEHVNFPEGKSVLKSCYKWLKPEGVLQIHTVNAQFAASLVARDDYSPELHEAMRWLYSPQGDGELDLGGYHRWSYSKKSLTKILSDIGFQILEAGFTCGGYGLTVTALKRQ